MRGYFCIGFINYTVKGKILLDYTSLFSSKKFEKNDEKYKDIFYNLKLKLFLSIDSKKMAIKKTIVLSAISIKI